MQAWDLSWHNRVCQEQSWPGLPVSPKGTDGFWNVLESFLKSLSPGYPSATSYHYVSGRLTICTPAISICPGGGTLIHFFRFRKEHRLKKGI